jgi:ornithine carbamoyltransferase
MRHLLSIKDINREEFYQIFKLTDSLKARIEPPQQVLKRKTLALIFEKPSLRTYVTFTLGIKKLGGEVIYLSGENIGLGKREAISDVAQNLSLWLHGLIVRTFSQETLLELAKYSKIPVINALTDEEHPCQVVSDLYTIWKKLGRLEGRKLVFIGDGSNNIATSLLYSAPRLGINLTICSPPEYLPSSPEGKSVILTQKPREAVQGAEVIYTDVWVSMGQEKETSSRKKIFQPYQVNKELITSAGSQPLIMHCLPAHRGEEITSEVLDGPGSIVLAQAANRLYVQMALLILLFRVI